MTIIDNIFTDSIKEKIPAVEAEKLLRIALFSDTLRLSHAEDRISPDDMAPSLMTSSSRLVLKRQALAQSLRENRKKGVVPVFVSLMWFLFSLAISIQASFGDLGSNQTAHDLALGLLLGWLPVMILVTIVDRNPTAIEAIRRKLNNLVDEVRSALLDHGLRDSYMTETRRSARDFAWTECLRDEDFFFGDFFTQFSGQGRVRWHYGVAHSILAGIESKFMAVEGRNWLRNPDMALVGFLHVKRSSLFPHYQMARSTSYTIEIKNSQMSRAYLRNVTLILKYYRRIWSTDRATGTLVGLFGI